MFEKSDKEWDIIKNVLNNKTRREHIDQLKKTKVDLWEIPQPDKPIMKSAPSLPSL